MACFANVVALANGSHMGIATTAWGIIVALSRALLGRHYLGDVFAGALVGILNAALISQVRPIQCSTARAKPLDYRRNLADCLSKHQSSTDSDCSTKEPSVLLG